jgi:hypothetical protein
VSEEITNPAPAGKKPCSEARRRANVENSKKSTGPGAAGKSISRYNRLIHGLRAETILPGEGEMYQALLDAHIDELGADTPLQRLYIERAVLASLKLLRGDRVECALASGLRTAAAAASAERDAADLERLKTQIAVDPAGTVRQLRKSVAGCLWIQESWLVLQKRLDKYVSMLPSQRFLSINLLGKHMSDIYSDDSEVTRWVVAHLGTLSCGERELDTQGVIENTGKPRAWMAPKELEVRVAAVISSIPEAAQARRLLLGYIGEELAKLKQHIELVTEVANQKRACDLRAAEVALNAEGKQLLGYVTTHRQAYDAALRKHDVLRNPRRPGPRRGPGPGPGLETARGQSEGERPAALAPDAEAAVEIQAACCDGESPAEAIPESLPLTEDEGTDEPALEPARESPTLQAPEPAEQSFFTTEPNLPDEPPIEPADERSFTTEANLSDEPPIVLEAEGPGTAPPWPGGWTREQAAQYHAARIAAAVLPPLDPQVAAALAAIGKPSHDSVQASLKERLDKTLAELDAKESRDRAEFMASLRAKYGSPRPAAVPGEASNPDAPRAPPAGGAPAG